MCDADDGRRPKHTTDSSWCHRLGNADHLLFVQIAHVVPFHSILPFLPFHPAPFLPFDSIPFRSIPFVVSLPSMSIPSIPFPFPFPQNPSIHSIPPPPPPSSIPSIPSTVPDPFPSIPFPFHSIIHFPSSFHPGIPFNSDQTWHLSVTISSGQRAKSTRSFHRQQNLVTQEVAGAQAGDLRRQIEDRTRRPCRQRDWSDRSGSRQSADPRHRPWHCAGPMARQHFRHRAQVEAILRARRLVPINDSDVIVSATKFFCEVASTCPAPRMTIRILVISPSMAGRRDA